MRGKRNSMLACSRGFRLYVRDRIGGWQAQRVLTTLSQSLFGDSYELSEQRVRTVRARLEFGVELYAQHERLSCHFHDLHQAPIG